MQPRGRRVNDSLLKENEKAKADILTGLHLIFRRKKNSSEVQETLEKDSSKSLLYFTWISGHAVIPSVSIKLAIGKLKKNVSKTAADIPGFDNRYYRPVQEHTPDTVIHSLSDTSLRKSHHEMVIYILTSSLGSHWIILSRV